MKKVVAGANVILILLLLMSLACATAGNEPPNAYIDSISPSPGIEGEEVSFNGHGTDVDGSVVAYNWNSSIDAKIGTTASFSTSELSPGTHTIINCPGLGIT